MLIYLLVAAIFGALVVALFVIPKLPYILDKARRKSRRQRRRKRASQRDEI